MYIYNGCQVAYATALNWPISLYIMSKTSLAYVHKTLAIKMLVDHIVYMMRCSGWIDSPERCTHAVNRAVHDSKSPEQKWTAHEHEQGLY